uniref:Uncharacterized protein n=1 Tax=Eutreptia viridis TaxID=96908 RepID=H8ZXF3_9EUGL|nr:hypothetical protein [Eutreptia viridis]
MISILIILIGNLRILIFYWVGYFKLFITFFDFTKILTFLFLRATNLLFSLWFSKFKSKTNVFCLRNKYFPLGNKYLFQNKLRSTNWIFCVKYFSKKKLKNFFIPKFNWLLSY